MMVTDTWILMGSPPPLLLLLPVTFGLLADHTDAAADGDTTVPKPNTSSTLDCRRSMRRAGLTGGGGV